MVRFLPMFNFDNNDADIVVIADVNAWPKTIPIYLDAINK